MSADHAEVRGNYFLKSTWSPGPTEVGFLANDNYDPTFGDGGVTCGMQVYECMVCGAAVLATAQHVEWHEAMKSGSCPPSGGGP